MKYILLAMTIFLGACTQMPPISPDVPKVSTVLPDVPVGPMVRAGEQIFVIEVADSPAARAQGLMYRTKMPQDAGMLFVFPTQGIHSFWMKNTLIPLDLVWISADQKIVDIQTLQPCPTDMITCPSYPPRGMAQYVLEVNAGAFTGEIGDSVELNF